LRGVSKDGPRQDTNSRSRRMFRARFCHSFGPLSSEGAGNAGRPMRPIAACAEIVELRTRVVRSHRKTPGIPRAMVLTASFALSPATGLFCHRRPRKLLSANLTPASGRQDHATSPSASRIARQARRPRPSHPAPTFVTLRNAPLSGAGPNRYSADLGSGSRENSENQKLNRSAIWCGMAMTARKMSAAGHLMPATRRKPGPAATGKR
jgi:hypothetical protein